MSAIPVADGHFVWTRRGGYRFEGDYSAGARHGIWRVFRADGTPAWETTWRHGAWHGRSSAFYPDGVRREEGEYADGIKTGVWRFWFPDGKPAAVGSYEHDRKIAGWTYWDEDGNSMEYADWNALTMIGIGRTTITAGCRAGKTGRTRGSDKLRLLSRGGVNTDKRSPGFHA